LRAEKVAQYQKLKTGIGTTNIRNANWQKKYGAIQTCPYAKKNRLSSLFQSFSFFLVPWGFFQMPHFPAFSELREVKILESLKMPTQKNTIKNAVCQHMRNKCT